MGGAMLLVLLCALWVARGATQTSIHVVFGNHLVS